jgi:short subunit dehydrogenase-like uncharacterized protein
MTQLPRIIRDTLGPVTNGVMRSVFHIPISSSYSNTGDTSRKPHTYTHTHTHKTLPQIHMTSHPCKVLSTGRFQVLSASAEEATLLNKKNKTSWTTTAPTIAPTKISSDPLKATSNYSAQYDPHDVALKLETQCIAVTKSKTTDVVVEETSDSRSTGVPTTTTTQNTEAAPDITINRGIQKRGKRTESTGNPATVGRTADSGTTSCGIREETVALGTTTTTQSLNLPSAPVAAALVPSDRSIETDITVYGATSFCAKHVLTYLMQASLAPGAKTAPLRITLAGRSEPKLERLQTEFSKKIQHLVTIYPSSAASCTFDVYVADCDNASKLRDMAARSAVVLNCAGPFAQHGGTNVVAACAQTGADYIDITGEITWAGDMRQRHGAAAARSGARITSFCGFDSVPSDLAVFCATQALRQDAHVEIDSAVTFHACLGFANGGTVQTLLGMPLNLSRCLFRRVPFLLDDPLVLTHPRVRGDPAFQATRNRMAMAEWKNQLPLFHSIFQMGVSAPFFMAPVNTKIVNASAIALGYGPNFVYNERHLPAGYKMTAHLGTLALVPALLTQIGVSVGMLVLKLPLIGKVLANLLAPAGSGSSDAACRAGHAEVYAQVSSAVTRNKNGRVYCDRANCFIQFEGDPGNYVTAQCVSEAALTLLYNRDQLPARSEDGFGTPAQTLGVPYVQRLQNSTVRPVNIVTHVRKAVSGMEWRMYP